MIAIVMGSESGGDMMIMMRSTIAGRRRTAGGENETVKTVITRANVHDDTKAIANAIETETDMASIKIDGDFE